MRVAVVLAMLAACRLGFEERVLDEDARSADGMTTTDDGGSPRCPSDHGPMTLVPQGFCIDNTEVSKRQYAEFLDAAPAVKTDGRCAFNTTYMPVGYVWTATMDLEQAVAGADWCDARDYCAWAGKRLCGRIGGGSLAYTESAATDAQWYMACSQGGNRVHPYGTAADDAPKPVCHLDDANNAVGAQTRIDAHPDCALRGTNVVDLLGNVQEWVDACETTAPDPADDKCKTVGGTWYFSASYSDCDFWDSVGGAGVPRDAEEKHIGFRCCAD